MKKNKSEEILKRIIDIFGLLICVIIFSPVFIEQYKTPDFYLVI